MTQEEKARAYDEALEKAKEFHDGPTATVVTRTFFEQVFPQLRESEDERIRKDLLGFVNSFWADHKEKLPQISKWIMWLEKQKEVDSTPLDWNDYKDKPIEIWNAYIKGKTVGIEIGKQKEQNSNIELIQRSWYMEGYHDREFGREPMWIIKTGEDGPKYEKNEKYRQPIEETKPVEDIAKEITKDKDSAIRFLKAAGIMNENGELAEIYRSEQKEQKLMDKHTKNTIYEEEVEAAEKRYDEEYSAGEYCHKQSFMWGFQEGIDWHKEHVETKSMDDVLIETSYAKVNFPFKAKVKSTGKVVTITDGQLSIDGRSWIKFSSDKADGFKIYEPNCLSPVQIRQKRVETFYHDYNPEDYEVVMDGNATKLVRKEQKPVDYDHEMWKNCEANFEGGKKEVIDHPEKYGLQKAVEWSEEDKDYYDTIVRKLEVIGDDSGLSDNQIKFLREHCPSHCLEWSEEDERYINGLIGLIEDMKVGISPKLRGVAADRCISFLKSLRPKPKKDLSKIKSKIILALHHATNCADAQNAIKETGVEVADVADWLFEQDDNSSPHWKLSEEQMILLEKVYHYLFACEDVPGNMIDDFVDFIENLKDNM